MKELESAGSAFESDAAKDNLKDIISDLGSATLESVGENLPGIGVVFKIGKALSSIRDYELMNKALTFLYELSKMSAESREKLIKKINSDPIFGQKFGTFILTAIDRHDFKEKSAFLAVACKFYERGDMSKENFIRIKTMIELNDLIDLKGWVQKTMIINGKIAYGIHGISSETLQKFIFTGVVRVGYHFDKIKPKDKSGINNTITSEVIRHNLSSVGRLLMNILSDVPLNPEDTRNWDLK